MTVPAPHGQGTAAPEGPAQPDAAQPAGFGAVLPTSAPARSPRDCWPPERAAWTPSLMTSGCPDGGSFAYDAPAPGAAGNPGPACPPRDAATPLPACLKPGEP